MVQPQASAPDPSAENRSLRDTEPEHNRWLTRKPNTGKSGLGIRKTEKLRGKFRKSFVYEIRFC